MRYTDRRGEQVTGTVWCPGPLAHSLWVLPDVGGPAIVVKVPRGDVSSAVEAGEWTVESGLDALAGLRDPDPIRTLSARPWDRRTAMGSVPTAFRPYVARMFFRHAPALREKVWRAAVDQDADQLTLTA